MRKKRVVKIGATLYRIYNARNNYKDVWVKDGKITNPEDLSVPEIELVKAEME